MPPRPLIFVFLLVLGVLLAWQLGDQRGYLRGVEEGTAASAAAMKMPEPLPKSSDALEVVTRERDLALATVASLRDEMVAVDALSATDKAELELYRRIGHDDATTGLGIDAISLVSGETGAIRVTLVQSRGRKRVGGRLVVSVAPDELASDPTNARSRPRLATGVPARFDDQRTVWEAPFDLRFFQTLDVPVDIDGDLDERMIRVDVIPTIGPHKALWRQIQMTALPAAD